MARYSFHAYSGNCFAQDFEVHDLPDLEAACGAARDVAEHFWVFLPRHLRQESLTIEIEGRSVRDTRPCVSQEVNGAEARLALPSTRA
jgi:hypothetical protein